MLEELQQQWTQMAVFFDMIAHIIKVCLSKGISDFANVVSTGVETKSKGMTIADVMRDNIYLVAADASKIAFHVNRICYFYYSLSTDYFMPQISSLSTLVYLDPVVKPVEYESARAALVKGCKDAQEAIIKRAGLRINALKAAAANRQKSLGEALKALPSPLPQMAEIEKGIMSAVRTNIRK